MDHMCADSIQQKVVSPHGFAKKRRGDIALCGLLVCAAVGINCAFVDGSVLSADRQGPQRHVGVAMYERAPHGVGDSVVLMRSDNSWHRAVVTDVKNDGTTILRFDEKENRKKDSPMLPKVGGSSSMKSLPTRRSNFGIRKFGAPVDPFKSEIVEAIRRDLENRFTDGFVSTPFSPNVYSANPFFNTKGRLTFEFLKNVSPLHFLNLYLAGDGRKFKIKSIQQADPDVDPFYGIASPPRGRIQNHWADATWAVHAEWEIEGKGPLQTPLVSQRPFYLSGHDVFRINANGKVITHEKGFDQDLRSILSYFDPYTHIPGFDRLYPVDHPKKDY